MVAKKMNKTEPSNKFGLQQWREIERKEEKANCIRKKRCVPISLHTILIKLAVESRKACKHFNAYHICVAHKKWVNRHHIELLSEGLKTKAKQLNENLRVESLFKMEQNDLSASRATTISFWIIYSD